jgi:predicted N-acyltransferase
LILTGILSFPSILAERSKAMEIPRHSDDPKVSRHVMIFRAPPNGRSQVSKALGEPMIAEKSSHTTTGAGAPVSDPAVLPVKPTTLSHSIYTSITEIPRHEWDLLTADDDDLTMDFRLIHAYETTMAGQCSCFAVVIRDEAQKAIALACACLFRVDAGLFPWLNKIVAGVRKVWPNCLKFGVLFCGLPIPAGQSHLRIAPHADRAAVLTELDGALRHLARDQGAMIVVVKEFSAPECDGLQTLLDRGYLRGEIPARHVLAGEFVSFDNYLDALKARYRSEVNRSLKKFREMGLRAVQVRGPVDLPRIYTDEVHRLYEAVQKRSEYRLELYPAQFMRELGRQFGDDASLTCIYRVDKLIGFTIGLVRGSIYHNLYSGLDYESRTETDLYFNLFYRDLDFAWRRGAKVVHLGQTSDDFKSRLGSESEPMYLFIRPTNRAIRWAFKRLSRWALPRMEPVKPCHVFKAPEHASQARKR